MKNAIVTIKNATHILEKPPPKSRKCQLNREKPPSLVRPIYLGRKMCVKPFILTFWKVSMTLEYPIAPVHKPKM